MQEARRHPSTEKCHRKLLGFLSCPKEFPFLPLLTLRNWINFCGHPKGRNAPPSPSRSIRELHATDFNQLLWLPDVHSFGGGLGSEAEQFVIWRQRHKYSQNWLIVRRRLVCGLDQSLSDRNLRFSAQSPAQVERFCQCTHGRLFCCWHGNCGQITRDDC